MIPKLAEGGREGWGRLLLTMKIVVNSYNKLLSETKSGGRRPGPRSVHAETSFRSDFYRAWCCSFINGQWILWIESNPPNRK